MGEPQQWIGRRLGMLGKTGKGLAEKLNLPEPRVSDIIRGIRRLAVTELPILASYLEMSVVDVLEAIAGKLDDVVLSRTLLTIRGSVGRGKWIAHSAWPPNGDRRMPLPVPAKYSNTNAFGLEVVGDDDLYPNGTILICVLCGDFDRPLKTGHRVIATRALATGEIEAFTSEFVEGDSGEKWLITGSTHPRHKAPIPIRGDSTDPTIYAVIIGKFSEESTE